MNITTTSARRIRPGDADGGPATDGDTVSMASKTNKRLPASHGAGEDLLQRAADDVDAVRRTL